MSAQEALERAVASLPLLSLPGDPGRPPEWDREPGEEELWGDWPDPDTAPPAHPDPVAALLPPELLAAYLEPATAVPSRDRVGSFARHDPYGAGFTRGGAADGLPPGEVLAGLAGRAWASPFTAVDPDPAGVTNATVPGGPGAVTAVSPAPAAGEPGMPAGNCGPAEAAWAGRLDAVSDDGLIGLMMAWRRLQSWATAGEAAAIAELDRRRTAQVEAGADPHLAVHVPDEIAIPLTLTTRAADQLHDFACRLAELPCTMAALAAGRIDRPKATVIAGALTGLAPRHAAHVEAAVIGRAPAQTTGQLRASLRRAILAVDPGAAHARRDEARKDARVEAWAEPAGTAALAGRDLPAADVLAADKHLTTLARHLKKSGAEGTLAQLRARAYLALLLGKPVTARPGSGFTPPGPGGGGQPGGTSGGATGSAAARTPEPPVLTGSINLTMPVTTWLDGTTGAGEAPGFGPIPADDAQRLARQLAGTPATRWCVTLTSPGGRAVAHGCAHRKPAGTGPGDWELTVTIRPLATGTCSHERETKSYLPGPALRHLICTRQPTCTAPGCRRPATTCDLDHTIPYHQGGRTCECNLAPLCRRHHRAKQAHGWHLSQAAPGTLSWRLPHLRTYTAEPAPYPPDPGPGDPSGTGSGVAGRRQGRAGHDPGTDSSPGAAARDGRGSPGP